MSDLLAWFRTVPNLILGMIAGAVIAPFFLIFKIVMMLFGRPIKRTPEEVSFYLRSFIDGTASDDDFEDFKAPITDPKLDSIRSRAGRIDLLSDEGLASLRALLSEAEALVKAARRGE